LYIPLDWEGRIREQAAATSDGPAGNLGAAINWAFSPTGDPRLGVSLTIAAAPHLMHLSLANECREYVSRALGALEADPRHGSQEEMKLLTAHGVASLCTATESAGTKATFARAQAIADALNDECYRLCTRGGLCVSCFKDGDFLAAWDVVNEFHSLALASLDPQAAISANLWVVGTLHVLGEQAAARQHAERVLGRSDVAINWRAIALGQLGAILRLQGRHDLATKYLEESEREAFASNDATLLCTILTNWVCILHLIRGDIISTRRNGLSSYCSNAHQNTNLVTGWRGRIVSRARSWRDKASSKQGWRRWEPYWPNHPESQTTHVLPSCALCTRRR
jgi:hypothetical protein